MKTNERPYKDPALREALRKDCSWENMLTDDFEQQVMMKITMRQRRKPYFRVAATFIGILMLSGLAFAAYHFAVGESVEKLLYLASRSPLRLTITSCFSIICNLIAYLPLLPSTIRSR